MSLKTMKDVEIAMKAGVIRTFAQQNEAMEKRIHLTVDERDARMIYIKECVLRESK